MKVSELIQALQKLDQDSIIFLRDYDLDDLETIVDITGVEYVESPEGCFNKVPTNQPLPILKPLIKQGYWIE
jgi:hypothetical protein